MTWGAYQTKAKSEAGSHYFATWSVRKKLLLSLIPSVLLILVVAGYVTNWSSTRYLNQALQRTAQVQNLAQVNAMEGLLEYFRKAGTALAEQQPSKEQLRAALEQWRVQYPGAVKELSYVGVNSRESTVLLRMGDHYKEVDPGQFNYIKGGPTAAALKLRDLPAGNVLFSELTEVVYPPGAMDAPNGTRSYVLYRLTAAVHDELGLLKGYIVIGIDAYALRNILSLYNSSKSPLHAFARTSENRFSYYFDDQGWILFQSENLEEPERELSGETARLGMTGDYGMPDYDKAFRPSPKHEAFWRMVVDVQAGRGGVDDIDTQTDAMSFLSANHFIVYAPVRFRTNPDKEPEVIGGVAYIDRSRLTDAAEFSHFDAMMVIAVSGMGLVTLVIFVISRGITRPLAQLTAEIRAMFTSQSLHTISIDSRDQESDLLMRAVNRMILSIQDKQEQIRRRDEQIFKVQQREKVSFDDEIPTSLGWRLVGEIPDLIGQSQAMATLQTLIRKAASTEADVLIVGETGTGKELTAEAIHKFSNRANKPFISINCGGLDENLLMDTLFGHVRGAFTEARTDRKGAFLASDGGTLFLDEIGTATDKVQKALLRALSVRRIRPLGSDQELEFNVRVVTATNVDLMELVQRGEFRDDLYYRLKVIYIQTPSLRQRTDDIPVLANHFLKEIAAGTGRVVPGLSRGALEKLRSHDWPGNVRELKNCITRAVAFADGEVLYAEDIEFDESERSNSRVDGTLSPVTESNDVDVPRGVSLEDIQPVPYAKGNDTDDQRLEHMPRRPSMPARPDVSDRSGKSVLDNPRMQLAMRLAKEPGGFSRQEYQKAAGTNVSSRTAQYDLQAMVAAGVLRKTGKGPATRYVLV